MAVSTPTPTRVNYDYLIIWLRQNNCVLTNTTTSMTLTHNDASFRWYYKACNVLWCGRMRQHSIAKTSLLVVYFCLFFRRKCSEEKLDHSSQCVFVWQWFFRILSWLIQRIWRDWLNVGVHSCIRVFVTCDSSDVDFWWEKKLERQWSKTMVYESPRRTRSSNERIFQFKGQRLLGPVMRPPSRRSRRIRWRFYMAESM